jgi:glycosyltransferase involved in cell wall biosynthesis
MHILLINHYAGSPEHGMEYRPYYLAREWVNLGHQVTIAAASYSHLRLRQPDMTGHWVEEHIDGIRYVWLQTPEYRGNGVRRVWNMAVFVRRLRSFEAEVVGPSKPDAVIASSPHPFVVVPARRIARRHGARLVFEVRDLWPLTLIDLSGMARWHPLIQCLQWTENYAYRHADRVVAVLPKAASYMQAHGMSPEKFACVPNGICLEDWTGATAPLPAEHAAAIERLRKERRFLVGYVGQHSLSNALDAFVESASLLESSNIALVLVGQGPEKARLEAKSRERGAKNIVFLPPVSKNAVAAVLASMDALFLGWKRQPLYRYGISPNKLMEYMMAAKPVIHAVEAGNDPVAESSSGISCAPEDPAAIVKAVRQLMGVAPEQRDTMGRRGREHVLRHYQYPMLARQFLEIMATPESAVATK